MPALTTILAVTSAILTVASISYQIKQAKKAKEKAERAAESRRGFETVSEGEVIALPIVYGRAKLGGSRAWVSTASSLYFTGGSNADTVIGSVPSSSLSGSKNEYLAYQQAICQGPINSIYDVILDDNFAYNETEFKRVHIECHINGGANYDGHHYSGYRQ